MSDLPLKLQRRILRFVNAARIPEDFLRLPRRIRDTGDEHELMHEPRGEAHEDDEHDQDHDDDKFARVKLEHKTAIEIIRRRPPLGAPSHSLNHRLLTRHYAMA